MLCLDMDDLMAAWDELQQQHHALHTTEQHPHPHISPFPLVVHSITISQRIASEVHHHHRPQQADAAVLPHPVNTCGSTVSGEGHDRACEVVASMEPELLSAHVCEKPKQKRKVRSPRPHPYGQQRFTMWRWKPTDPSTLQQRAKHSVK